MNRQFFRLSNHEMLGWVAEHYIEPIRHKTQYFFKKNFQFIVLICVYLINEIIQICSKVTLSINQNSRK